MTGGVISNGKLLVRQKGKIFERERTGVASMYCYDHMDTTAVTALAMTILCFFIDVSVRHRYFQQVNQ